MGSRAATGTAPSWRSGRSHRVMCALCVVGADKTAVSGPPSARRNADRHGVGQPLAQGPGALPNPPAHAPAEAADPGYGAGGGLLPCATLNPAAVSADGVDTGVPLWSITMSVTDVSTPFMRRLVNVTLEL